MKLKKDLVANDLVIYRPQRYNLEQQPFTVTDVKELDLYISNEHRHFWVRRYSTRFKILEHREDLKEQYDLFLEDLKGKDKTWNSVAVGDYYRRYMPSYGGMVYYKITRKEAPEHPAVYHRVFYKYRTRDSNYDAREGTKHEQNADRKIWGRNFKRVSKLEGMLVIGE